MGSWNCGGSHVWSSETESIERVDGKRRKAYTKQCIKTSDSGEQCNAKQTRYGEAV